MKEDPVEWLARQWQVGVNLREEGRGLRTQGEAAAWAMRAAERAQELRDGIAIRNPRDVARVKTLNRIPVEHLPLDHPWHEIIPFGMHTTTTGEGRPGNNPYSRHAALVDRVEEILGEWRAALPKSPKPASTNITYDKFGAWYVERANIAKPEDRSSREEDRKAAEQHFQCRIPYEWIEQARHKLSDDHPYRTKGRRPS